MGDGKRMIQALENHRFRELLFPEQPIHIGIRTKKKHYSFILSKNMIQISYGNEENESCIIIGDEEVIGSIFSGKIKLQEASKFQHIQLKGNYRTILLLETILWLNRPIKSDE